MAVISNVHKYTIKHIKDTEDALEIPAYPNSNNAVSIEDNLISIFYNDMYGTAHDIPIALKLKSNWVFDLITDADLQELYGNRIRKKIRQYKSRFFEINAYFPGEGWMKGTFYLGTPMKIKSVYGGHDDGTIDYWSMELHWIEVDGEKLLSPLDPIVE